MPLVYADRVLEITETEGLVAYALDGTIPGWQAFDAIGSGNQCYYCAFASDDFGAAIGAWEVGKGTFGARALTRDQILASSNGGAAVDWQPGTRRIMNVHPAAALGLQALPAHASSHQPGGSDAMQVDAAAATGSLRTLGLGATQAAAGNDPRLSDARPPQAHAGQHAAGGGDVVDVKALGGYPGGTTNFLRADGAFAAPPSGGGAPAPHHATHEPGGSDPLAVDAAPAVGSLRTLGTEAQQAAAGTDARLSDARTPKPHASSHAAAGADPVPVTGLAGFPGGTTNFLRADGTFAPPSSGGGAPAPHAATHQPGGSDAMQVDAAAATGSLRTLGSGAQQAAPGNDARLSNARPPTAHAGTHSVNGGDPVNITLLAGFSGDANYVLRGDRTFGVNHPYLNDAPQVNPVYGDFFFGWQASPGQNALFPTNGAHSLLLREFGSQNQIELNASQTIYPGYFYYVATGGLTLTLPDSASYVNQIMTIAFGVQMGQGVCTLSYSGPNGIDGLASRTFWQREVIILRAGPYYWSRIGGTSLKLNAKFVAGGTQNFIGSTNILYTNWAGYLDNLGNQLETGGNAGIRVKRAGTYRMHGHTWGWHPGPCGYAHVHLFVNGGVSHTYGFNSCASGSNYMGVHADGLEFLNIGDFVQLYYQHNCAGAADVNASLEIEEVNPYR